LVDAATNDSPVEASRNVFFGLLGDLYGPTGQARAVVWGIPMIVFAMVAAISQR
jgi:hypothetical protein